jgi:hypothetical protein
MVAASAARVRPTHPIQTPAPTLTPIQSLSAKKPRWSAASWVLIGLPVLLVGAFIWQIASSTIHTDIVVRQAVAVGQVSLESDPAGSRVDFVLVDRVGQETTVDGTVTVKLREPDGRVWQTSREVTESAFQQLPDGSLLAGRTGYSVTIPASDWARAPRRGGSATVTINVKPSGEGSPFSTVAEERFP